MEAVEEELSLDINTNDSQINCGLINDSKCGCLCFTAGTSPPSMVLTFLPSGGQLWTSISVNQLWYVDQIFL